MDPSIPPPWPATADAGGLMRLETLKAEAEALLSELDTGAPSGRVRDLAARARAVGLAFDVALHAAAARAGLPLAARAGDAEICARLLHHGGETSRAARLARDSGHHGLAARLAESCGDLDLLQDSLQAVGAVHGRQEEAAHFFRQYQGLRDAGRFSAAAEALRRAMQARPDNPAYPPLWQALERIRPPGHRLSLSAAGSRSPALVLARDPAVVGRADDAAIRLKAHGVSRHHARALAQGGAGRLERMDGGVLWSASGSPGQGATPVTIGHSAVTVAVHGAALLVTAGGVPHLVVGMEEVPFPPAPDWSVAVQWSAGAGFPELTSRAPGQPGVLSVQEVALGTVVSLGGTEWVVGG